MNTSNNSAYGFAEGCFTAYNVIACTRDGLEVLAAVVTGIFCITKLVKLHAVKHELWNQYLIFYSAIVEIILLTLNWMYLRHSAVTLVAELFKLFQFIVVCRFYCEVASRLAKTENLYRRVFLPALSVTGVYFVILTLFGIIKRKGKNEECTEIVWIQLSGSEVALGVVFIVIGIYITRKTDNLKTDTLFKRNIKLSLWGIILSFQLSSVISLAYDILMLFIGKKNLCKGLFLHSAAGFTITDLFLKICKWLLPIWAMIIIYKPESFKSNDELENTEHPTIIQRSSDGIFKSEFRPRGKSFNYKHLRDPENENERDLLSGSNVENFPETKVKKKKKRNRSGGSTSVSPGTPQTSVKKKSPTTKAIVAINSQPVDVSTKDPVM